MTQLVLFGADLADGRKLMARLEAFTLEDCARGLAALTGFGREFRIA